MWLQELQSRVQNAEQISEDDYNESVIHSLNDYNGYHSQSKSILVASLGAQTFSIPSNWIDNYSKIISIEYPIAEVLILSNPSNYPIPALRESSDYTIIDKTVYLKFTFDASTSLRMSYTLPYTIDTIETAPSHHLAAMLDLATAYVFAKLAAYFSGPEYDSMGVEVVNFKGKSYEYLQQANWYRDKWEQAMELGKYAKDDNVGAEFSYEAVSRSRLKQFSIDRTHRMFKPSYERPIYVYSS